MAADLGPFMSLQDFCFSNHLFKNTFPIAMKDPHKTITLTLWNTLVFLIYFFGVLVIPPSPSVSS